VEILVDFFLAMLLTAGILWFVGKLNLGMSVSGFGAAFAAAVVLAAFGFTFWLAFSAWRIVTAGDVSLILMWLTAALLLWLAGKFVPGFEVKSYLSAVLVALVIAFMYMLLFGIVENLNL
jgi:uncharacterized membrane protein YvlD (DUF360 family)